MKEFTLWFTVWLMFSIFPFQVLLAQDVFLDKPETGPIPFQPYFHHLSTSDGLPSNSVYNLHQDSKGHIWLCTDNGVARFNGQEFESFDLGNHVSSNSIVEVAEGLNGQIWFGTYQSEFFFYDPVKDDFSYPGFNDQLHNYHNNPWVEELYVTDSFLVLPGRAGNLLKVDITGDLDSFRIQSKKYSEFVSWVPVPGIGQVSVQNKKYVSDILALFPSSYFQSTNEPLQNSVTLVKGGWLFTYGKQMCFLDVNGKPRGMWEAPASIIGVHEYDSINQTAWVGCHAGGAFKISLKDRVGIVESILAGKSVTKIIEDDEGGLWVSTGQDGIYYRGNKGLYELKMPDRVSDFHTQAIAKHACSGKLYVGGNEGQVFSVLMNQKPSVTPIAQLAPLIVQFRNIGSDRLFAYTTSHNASSFGCLGKEEIVNQVFPGMYQDPMNGALTVLRAHKKRLISFEFSKPELFDIVRPDWSYGHLKEVIHISNSMYYLVAHNGLLLYNSSTKDVDAISLTDVPRKGVEVTDVGRLRGDTFLVAANGRGLLILVKNEVLSILSKSNLLASNRCLASVVRGDTLWVGTDKGVQEIILKEGTYCNSRQFRPESGFPISHVNCMEYYRNGLLIGTESSLLWLDLKKTPDNEASPIIQLASIYFDGQIVLPSSIGQFKVPRSKGTLEISFEQRGFKNLFKRLYRYRIEGLDTHWTENNTGNLILHQTLPGAYKLQVSGMNRNGLWSAPTTIASFSIPKPYYATIGFKLSATILVLILIIIFIYAQRLRVERDARITLSLSAAKNKALSAQLNPHFLYNVLNTIGGAIVRGEKNDSLETITRFSKLMRQVFDNSHNDLVVLNREVMAIESYVQLEKKRMAGQLDFQLKTDQVSVDSLMVPPLLLQPLVENAIWHGVSESGENGTVELEIEEGAEILTMKVKNTGEVFKNSSKLDEQFVKESSLSVINERLELLKKLYGSNVGLFYETKQGEWATVAVLHFPKIVKSS